MPAVEMVNAPGSAPPVGPYSPALKAGGFLFCSGQVGLDPASKRLVPGGTVAELRQALANVEALLKGAGLTRGHVVKTTLFLVDMAEFAAANEAYGAFFSGSPRPARSTVAVAGLPLGARVEVEVIAVLS